MDSTSTEGHPTWALHGNRLAAPTQSPGVDPLSPIYDILRPRCPTVGNCKNERCLLDATQSRPKVSTQCDGTTEKRWLQNSRRNRLRSGAELRCLNPPKEVGSVSGRTVYYRGFTLTFPKITFLSRSMGNRRVGGGISSFRNGAGSLRADVLQVTERASEIFVAFQVFGRFNRMQRPGPSKVCLSDAPKLPPAKLYGASNRTHMHSCPGAWSTSVRTRIFMYLT